MYIKEGSDIQKTTQNTKKKRVAIGQRVKEGRSVLIRAAGGGGGVRGSGCVHVKANSVVDEKSEVNQCRSALQVDASAIHPCVFLQCLSMC